MPVHFTVVQCIMLNAHSHSVGLHALHIGHHHLACEIGILAHILEVAAVERETVDVHAGAQKDCLVTVPGLFADILSVEPGEVPVPGGGKAAERRECRNGVVRPSRLVPFVPEDLGTDAVGAVGTPDFRNAQARDSGRTEF